MSTDRSLTKQQSIWRDRDFWIWGVGVPLGAGLFILGQIAVMCWSGK